MSEKKAYAPPRVRQWGTVADLTGVGDTRPGQDMFSGSVNPPGHANGKGR